MNVIEYDGIESQRIGCLNVRSIVIYEHAFFCLQMIPVQENLINLGIRLADLLDSGYHHPVEQLEEIIFLDQPLGFLPRPVRQAIYS